PPVPGVHDVLELGERLDGVGERRPDEEVGGVPPGAELDLVAVDEDQAAVTGQRAVGDDQVLGGRLARSGVAADRHVAFRQADVRLFGVLVNAQVDGVEDGQREDPHGCHGWNLPSGGVGQAPGWSRGAALLMEWISWGWVRREAASRGGVAAWRRGLGPGG